MSDLPKLVRDKIPDIIKESGASCAFEILPDLPDIRQHFLVLKLAEELHEFEDATSSIPSSRDSIAEEAADMLQVCMDLWSLWGLSLEDVLAIAQSKAQDRGGFGEGVYLLSVRKGDPQFTP